MARNPPPCNTRLDVWNILRQCDFSSLQGLQNNNLACPFYTMFNNYDLAHPGAPCKFVDLCPDKCNTGQRFVRHQNTWVHLLAHRNLYHPFGGLVELFVFLFSHEKRKCQGLEARLEAARDTILDKMVELEEVCWAAEDAQDDAAKARRATAKARQKAAKARRAAAKTHREAVKALEKADLDVKKAGLEVEKACQDAEKAENEAQDAIKKAENEAQEAENEAQEAENLALEAVKKAVNAHEAFLIAQQWYDTLFNEIFLHLPLTPHSQSDSPQKVLEQLESIYCALKKDLSTRTKAFDDLKETLKQSNIAPNEENVKETLEAVFDWPNPSQFEKAVKLLKKLRTEETSEQFDVESKVDPDQPISRAD